MSTVFVMPCGVCEMFTSTSADDMSWSYAFVQNDWTCGPGQNNMWCAASYPLHITAARKCRTCSLKLTTSATQPSSFIRNVKTRTSNYHHKRSCSVYAPTTVYMCIKTSQRLAWQVYINLYLTHHHMHRATFPIQLFPVAKGNGRLCAQPSTRDSRWKTAWGHRLSSLRGTWEQHYTVSSRCKDARCSDNRDVTTKCSGTVFLHCKSLRFNSNDAKSNDRRKQKFAAWLSLLQVGKRFFDIAKAILIMRRLWFDRIGMSKLPKLVQKIATKQQH